MDFELDDDQQALRDAVRDIVDKECSPAFVRSVIDEGDRPGAVVAHDGRARLAGAGDRPRSTAVSGYGWIELAIVLEELGRANDPSPFLGDHGDVRSRSSPTPATTSSSAALARPGRRRFDHRHARPRRRHRHRRSATDGTDGGSTARSATSSTATAPTRSRSSPTARRRPAVFVVERRRRASTATRTPAFDFAVHIADLTLDGSSVAADRRLGGADVAGGIERAVEEATLGWAMPTVGACQRILDMTVEYAKERHQFGVPIGSFQAVKHKAVDMYVAIERARAVCQYAALVLDAEDDPSWPMPVLDGQGRGRRVPEDRHPQRHPAVRRHRLHVGERSPDQRAPGQARRGACSAAPCEHRRRIATTVALAS